MGSVIALFLIAGHTIITFFSGALAAILTGFLFALGLPFVFKHFKYNRDSHKKRHTILFISIIIIGFIVGRLTYAFFVIQPWFEPLINKLSIISGLSKDNISAIILIALLYATITTSYHIGNQYIKKQHN